MTAASGRRHGGPVSLTFALLRNSTGAVLAFFSATREISRLYDVQLITSANVVRALLAQSDPRGGAAVAATELVVDDDALRPQDRGAFQVTAEWRMLRAWRAGRLVLRSDTGPPIGGAPAAAGFSAVDTPPAHWRVYTLVDLREGLVVQVGERRRLRNLLIHRIALDLLLPLLLLAPGSAALGWLAVRGGLRALRRLTRQLEGRDLGDGERLEPGDWPMELRPVVVALNRLLARIARVLRQERRLTDQAAHQMRTPFAVLKLQVQAARREADPARRGELVDALGDGVDRASQLVEQLLLMARLESGEAEPGACDLAEEAAQALSERFFLAEKLGVSVVLSGARPAPAKSDVVRTRIVITNLVDNALKYSPRGGEVEVRIGAEGRGWRLEVLDSGPGVAPPERERVFEPFYRAPGAAAPGAAAPGAGLGLTLVAQAVRGLDGRCGLSARNGRAGLRAWVWLPPTPMCRMVDTSFHQLRISFAA